MSRRPAGSLPSVGEMSLRSRIFLTNAAVAAAAALVLVFTPATVSSPPHLREVAIVIGGLVAILAIDLFLLARALAPLERLASLMRDVELLRPGRRVPVYGQEAEIVDLTRSFNEMLDRLEGEQRGTVQRALAAQESERERVAQELHDEVGQTLTAVVLQLERLSRIAPDALRPELEETRESARGSLDEIRMIAQRLRPEALDDLGLPSALVALTDRLSGQTGVSIERRIQRDLASLTPEAELVLYRVAQEGVTNALRHSGASAIEVSLRMTGGGVLLEVADDGCGVHGAEPGSGIKGMRERAVLIGARLDLQSRPGGGTTLQLRIGAV